MVASSKRGKNCGPFINSISARRSLGSKARVSAPASDFEQLFSRDVTACKVGAHFTAGVTMYMPGGLWTELHLLHADSIWRGQIVHESPKWLTIGCHDQDELEQVLGDLRTWREESSLSRDIWYRRWEIETREADGAYLVSTCLLYTSPSPRDQRGSRMPSSA